MLHRTFKNRYEIKYIANLKQVAALKNIIKNFFEQDINSIKFSGYYNFSIYFDSPSYFFYREKQEGFLKRIKPRLRTHLSDANEIPKTWFLELKGRHDRTIHKRRIKINHSTVKDLLIGKKNFKYIKDQTMKDFEYLWDRLDLKPSVSVFYFREPFNSEIFSNVRITFDYRIAASLNFDPFSTKDNLKYIIPPENVIIELKYINSIPRFILQIFRKIGVKQITFSKYALSLEACIDRLPILKRK